MKKTGAIILLILVIACISVLSRRAISSFQTESVPLNTIQNFSSSTLLSFSAPDTAKPALAQLRAHVSEDRPESAAEQSSFQNRLEDLIAEMPTLNNQAKPETDQDGHIHGAIPEELIEARVLGQLRKATFENPQHAARSQIVYAGCVERSDLSNAVRAVCFMRALELSIKVKNPQVIAALEVPFQVRNLAQRLISKGKL